MKPDNYGKIFRSIIILLLVSLSLSGSDCDKTVVDGEVPPDYLGDWQLKSQTGALQDICPDEVINLQSNGIATLTCPGSGAISRDYTIENSILSYIQTTVSYDAELSESNTKLALYGRNVSRNLFYEKIVSSNTEPLTNNEQEFNNSSEMREIK